MDKLITIVPLDIKEVCIETASPLTDTRAKIPNKVARILENFNSKKRGAIDSEQLKAIKPDFNMDSLPDYKENFELPNIARILLKSNDILVTKYGYTNFKISEKAKAMFTSALSNVSEEQLPSSASLEQLEELQVENSILQKENIALKKILNEYQEEESNVKKVA